MAYGVNKERAHREVHLAHVTDWLADRPSFRAAIVRRLEEVGLEPDGPLLRMTADCLGHALTGTSDHTHTGFNQWFDELLARELGQNDFLRRPGLPRPRPDAKFNAAIGKMVLETSWWSQNAIEVRRKINRNRAAREVLEG